MPRMVGEIVREAREALGLTRAELAELAGVARTTVWRIERGETEASPLVRRALCRVLGLEDCAA